MRLQIDTAAKTIKLEQSAKITEILSVIKKLLPNEWKEYSLETNTTIYNWQNPIYIYPSYPIYPIQPIWVSQPNTLTVGSMGISGTCATISTPACASSNTAVYNFEVQSN